MDDPGLLSLACLILAGTVFLVTLLNTDAAIMLLIFSMLLSPEIPLGAVPGRAVVIRFDDVLLGVVFFTWLAKLAINKQFGLVRSTPMNVPLGMFLLSCVVSTVWAIINGSLGKPLSSFFYFLKYAEYFMLYFMAVNIIQTHRQVERFLKAMFVTAAIVTLCGYWQMVHFGRGYRISAPFEGKPEPNTLAGYLLIMMAVSAGVVLYATSASTRLTCLGGLAAMLPPFVSTYSRGGYAAFLVTYATLGILSRRHRLTLLALFVAGLIFAPVILPETFFQRLAQTFDPRYGISGVQVGRYHLSASPAARILIWKAVYNEWFQHPFLGYGVTGAGFVDNQHALVIGELGLVGLAVYIWVRWRLLQISYRNFRAVDDPLAKGICVGFFAAFIGLLVHSFTGNIFIIVRIMEPFWFLAAMVTVLPQLVNPAPRLDNRGFGERRFAVEPASPSAFRGGLYRGAG